MANILIRHLQHFGSTLVLFFFSSFAVFFSFFLFFFAFKFLRTYSTGSTPPHHNILYSCPDPVPIWPTLCWWDVKPYSINQPVQIIFHFSIFSSALFCVFFSRPLSGCYEVFTDWSYTLVVEARFVTWTLSSSSSPQIHKQWQEICRGAENPRSNNMPMSEYTVSEKVPVFKLSVRSYPIFKILALLLKHKLKTFLFEHTLVEHTAVALDVSIGQLEFGFWIYCNSGTRNFTMMMMMMMMMMMTCGYAVRVVLV